MNPKRINWSQIVTTCSEQTLRFQNGTLNIGRGIHRKYLPYAFTEQGVSMLSGVLKSGIAVKVSIQIIDTFVYFRKINNPIFKPVEFDGIRKNTKDKPNNPLDK